MKSARQRLSTVAALLALMAWTPSLAPLAACSAPRLFSSPLFPMEPTWTVNPTRGGRPLVFARGSAQGAYKGNVEHRQSSSGCARSVLISTLRVCLCREIL